MGTPACDERFIACHAETCFAGSPVDRAVAGAEGALLHDIHRGIGPFPEPGPGKFKISRCKCHTYIIYQALIPPARNEALSLCFCRRKAKVEHGCISGAALVRVIF